MCDVISFQIWNWQRTKILNNFFLMTVRLWHSKCKALFLAMVNLKKTEHYLFLKIKTDL